MLVCGEVDHVIALALGGTHCVKNLQILSVEEHKEKTRRDRAEIRRQHAAAK
jgi:5-methylcytosine-specific restriction endonuclease McrA